MANTYHADFPAPERARGQAIPIEHRANLAIRCGRSMIAPAVWATSAAKGASIGRLEHGPSMLVTTSASRSTLATSAASRAHAFMVDVQWTNGWVSEHDGRELEFAGGQR